MMAFLIISIAAPAAFGEDYFIYAPKMITETKDGIPPLGKEELLVKEVQIKWGDTLSGISRRYSGRGSYFPQILLFNEIKNPDLIYAGSTLKVPVGKTPHATEAVRPAKPEKKRAVKKKPLPKRKQVEQHKPEQSLGNKQQDGGIKQERIRTEDRETQKPVRPERETAPFVAPAPESPRSNAPQPISPNISRREKLLFDQAMNSYKNNDCTRAVELFDRFVTEHDTSPLAAEASLLKAECLLKLSGNP